MNRRHRKLMSAVALTCLVMAGMINTAVATSSAWSFTMNCRHVNGRKNHRYHHLDAGNLTVNGNLLIHEKRAKAAGSPDPVTIEVLKGDADGNGNIICTVVVTPSTILNDKKAFSKSCGRIEADNYWLKIYKGGSGEDGDGWHSQGSGTLDTAN